MAKPTILFIHGGWHQPSHFDPVRELFESEGYPTSCPRQATIDALPPIGPAEDAQVMEAELDKLIVAEHKEVIVIAHSYGGVVATEAVKQSYSRKHRQSQGEQGGVLHLVFLVAFLLPPGSSLVAAFNYQVPPWSITEPNGQCYCEGPAQLLYNDLPESERQQWVDQLVKIPTTTQQNPLTYAAYLYHPVTYLFCENDQAMPLFIQKIMVATVVEVTGISVREETCTSGHSPFLSMPGRILELVEGLVG